MTCHHLVHSSKESSLTFSEDTANTFSVLWATLQRTQAQQHPASKSFRSLRRSAVLSYAMVFLDFIQSPDLQFVKWCWMILDLWSPFMTKFTCVISAMVVKHSGFDLAKGSAILIAVAFGSEFWSAQICATRSFLVSLLLAAAVTFCCSPPLLLGMWPLQVGNPLWNAEHWKTKCDYSCKWTGVFVCRILCYVCAVVEFWLFHLVVDLILVHRVFLLSTSSSKITMRWNTAKSFYLHSWGVAVAATSPRYWAAVNYAGPNFGGSMWCPPWIDGESKVTSRLGMLGGQPTCCSDEVWGKKVQL